MSFQKNGIHPNRASIVKVKFFEVTRYSAPEEKKSNRSCREEASQHISQHALLPSFESRSVKLKLAFGF